MRIRLHQVRNLLVIGKLIIVRVEALSLGKIWWIQVGEGFAGKGRGEPSKKVYRVKIRQCDSSSVISQPFNAPDQFRLVKARIHRPWSCLIISSDDTTGRYDARSAGTVQIERREAEVKGVGALLLHLYFFLTLPMLQREWGVVYPLNKLVCPLESGPPKRVN